MKYEYAKIDSRACGQGKTVDGIYKLIDEYRILNKPVLLVCGSIELQNQYKLHYPEIILINSQNHSNESTVSRLTYELHSPFNDEFRLICITHQTFMMLDSTYNRSKFLLIIDEALSNIYRSDPVKFTKIKYDWNYHFEFERPDDSYPTYEEMVDLNSFPRDIFYNLKILHSESVDDDNLIGRSEVYRHITDRNYDHYISPYDYNIMMNTDTTNQKSFEIFSLLNQNIFNEWGGIHIAAAAFDKTPMYYLFKKFGIYDKFDTIHDFKKHYANIDMHCYSNFKWSNNKRKKSSKYLDHFHNYVNRHSTGAVLALRNKDELSKLDNELLIGHSVHGLNRPEYQSITNISMESALLPSQYLGLFIRYSLLSNLPRTNDMDDEVITYNIPEGDQEKIIIHFHSVYLFYQAIMRCKLRSRDYNGEKINIFVLDHDVGSELFDYFDYDNTHEIPDIDNKPSLADRAKERARKYREEKKKSLENKKKTPMTSAERSRRHRNKKKTDSND